MGKLCEMKVEWKKHRILYHIIPCLIVIFTFVYYLPIYGIGFVDKKVLDVIGERVYGLLNPFTVTPYILSVITVIVFLLYDNLWVKGMVSTVYAMSIIFSLISIMGMTKISDFIVFLPHMICVLFIGYLEYKSWKKSKKGWR